MHVRWKVKNISGRAHDRAACPHGKPTQTIAPVLVGYVGRHAVVWRIGPSIRQCCIKARHQPALASWWFEVTLRFVELTTVGLDDAALAQHISEQEETILELLARRVPRARSRALDKISRELQQGQFVRRTQSPLVPHLRRLGLSSLPKAEELDAAWRATARRLHPDVGGTQEQFVAAQRSHERLKAFLARCSTP